MCAYRRCRDAGRTRIIRVIDVLKCPSAQCYIRAGTLQKFSPRHVNQGGQKNSLLNGNEPATPIISVRLLIS